MSRDFYQILGIKKGASKDEIKRAYRVLAKKHHPDRNPDDNSAEGRFKEVQEAYDTLKDKEKRAQYDRYGAAGVGKVATGSNGQRVYQWGGNASVPMDDLEDLFSAFGGRGGAAGGSASVFDQFFSGGQRQQVKRQPRRTADLMKDVSLSFDQAVGGATIDMRLTHGSGGGETLEVKIPAGVSEGQKIRVRGRVPGVNGSAAGDLILTCKIQPHAYYRREGADVYLDVPVSLTEAALGAKIDVPSLDGITTVTIPAGTSGGAKLRLSKRGIVDGKGDRGDFYVVIRITSPKELSDEQRTLLEKLHEADTVDPRKCCAWNKEVNV